MTASLTPAAVCRELSVSEATYHRWRNQFGGLKAEDQCLAVVRALGPGGYYIINGQQGLDTRGHHPFGIKTIDGFLDRGKK